MEDKHISRMYYVETFLLLGFFILVTLILSNVFVETKLESNRARELNDAVRIADSVGEIVETSQSGEDLEEIFKQAGFTVVRSGNSYVLFFNEKMEFESNGIYEVKVDSAYEELSQGVFTNGTITVLRNSDESEIYRLEVGKYHGEGAYE